MASETSSKVESSNGKGGALGQQAAQEPKNLPLKVYAHHLLWVGLIKHRTRRLPALYSVLHSFEKGVQLLSDTRIVRLGPPSPAPTSTAGQSCPSHHLGLMLASPDALS